MIDKTATQLGLDVDKLHKDMDDPTIAHEIAATHLLAKRAKIGATPTFIVNGKVRPGAVDDALLAEMSKGKRS